MSFLSFLKLVEIQTKAASVIPFLLGSVYAAYRFERFRILNFVLMFASLLCIDMATTAINNYMDYKKANRKFGYGYESHNAIVRDHIPESAVLASIAILLMLAAGFGVLLYQRTNLVVLLLGGLSFFIGILYSFGPVPISRTPFGEILSGGFMGFVIPFLAVYIHQPELINFSLSGGILQLKLNLTEIVFILLLSLPSVIGIGNIMFANNICDMEDDLENKRFTLPLYIGKKSSLLLYKLAYYAAFVDLIAAVLLGVIPLVSLLAAATLFVVQKNIKRFTQLQTKKDTFVTAVKNFVLMNCALVLTLLAQVLFQKLI